MPIPEGNQFLVRSVYLTKKIEEIMILLTNL